MTRDEWLDIGQHITAKWPHSQPPVESLAAWFEDVADLDAQQVRAAVSAHARGGDKFPPTGGMLRRRVCELTVDAPDFGTAWSLVLDAVRRFGYTDINAAMAWLEGHGRLVADLARRVGWRDICMSEEPGVIRGQARRIYESLVAQTTRDLTLRGLPDSGLATLERVNSPEYAELVDRTVAQMPQIGRGA